MSARAPAGPAEPLVARWEAFLEQIRQRHAEVMTEARRGCSSLLVEADYDPAPMGNAWTAMAARAGDLERKIDDTWFAQVSVAFDAAGVPVALFTTAQARGRTLGVELALERERNRVELFGSAARTLLKLAERESARPLACHHCGAPTAVPFTFRALNVTCAHCGTVNGFEPGTRMRLAENAVHWVCEEVCFPAWRAMHASERSFRMTRTPTLELAKAYETALLHYWHAYLSARLHYRPEMRAHLDADLRGKMYNFYELMNRERCWVEAGSPRALLP